ncbi:HAD family hydrolase [Clostridioides difficile]|uniref:HAD family hydrolase n=1 Tax=Clostridioides difficile TaxID=1496 RepID=UPI0029C1245D|nr:HAD family hydrolase [Clostridioides difficile]MDX5618150.1 HAD family hydrolase [Clostridioides difficile]
MIKLIATDLDGTLLDETSEINPEFYKVFKKLRERGIMFSAASGRQYQNLIKKFEDIKDDMMFISENGTLVVYKGKEILSNPLNKELVNEIIETTRSIKGKKIVMSGKKYAYIESKDEAFIQEVSTYYAKFKVVEDLTKVEGDILKIAVFDFKGAEHNNNIYFEKFSDRAQVCISGVEWLDLTAKGANKGSAIKKVQKMLDIKYEETMVFGDQLNDVEMMKSAYHSYAMENANEHLKQIARFRAKRNTENGVVDKIKEVIKIG